MKQFYHQEYTEKHNSPNRFAYRGQEVLLVSSGAAVLVVAGYINEDATQQSGAAKTAVTAVNPITDKEQRKELTNLLRENVKNKDIIFWG